MGDFVKHKQSPWQIVRLAVATGSPDAALTATTTKYASVLAAYGQTPVNTNDRWYTLPQSDDRVEIRFRSTLSNNNGTFVVVGLRKLDDAFTICSGKAYAGTQEATIQIASATTYHCDKINIETDGQEQWLSPVLSSSEDNTADNLCCSLVIKNNGYTHFLVLLTAVSAGSMAVDMSSYSTGA